MPLRLVMMGTGEFALPTFEALYGTAHTVVGLFTQPDRTGAGHHRHRNVMKELAVAQATPVFQPQKVNEPDGLDALRQLRPDLCVVAAYGQILSQNLLDIPTHGAINVHASLLPKYRGAAPIPYAIWQGETETGVSIFRIEPRLDAGPVLGMTAIPIGRKETAGQLEARLAQLAVPLTLQIIDQIEAGTAAGQLQDPALVTRAPRLKKTDGLIDWTQDAAAIERHIRAMQPWPNAFTYLHQTGRPEQRLILLDVDPLDQPAAVSADPGTVIGITSDRIEVATGSVPVVIRRLQPEGKRAMTVDAFLRGRGVTPGDRFGGPA